MAEEQTTLPGGVLLRGVIESDLPIFYDQQADPEATRIAAFPARGRERHMAHWATILADETVTTRTILFDGRVAGNIVRFNESGKPEVGYWLGREFWGGGIATRALAAFLDVIQERPLYAHVAKHNVASIRVLEKCGFTIVGEEKRFPDASGERVEELLLRLGTDKS